MQKSSRLLKRKSKSRNNPDTSHLLKFTMTPISEIFRTKATTTLIPAHDGTTRTMMTEGVEARGVAENGTVIEAEAVAEIERAVEDAIGTVTPAVDVVAIGIPDVEGTETVTPVVDAIKPVTPVADVIEIETQVADAIWTVAPAADASKAVTEMTRIVDVVAAGRMKNETAGVVEATMVTEIQRRSPIVIHPVAVTTIVTTTRPAAVAAVGVTIEIARRMKEGMNGGVEEAEVEAGKNKARPVKVAGTIVVVVAAVVAVEMKVGLRVKMKSERIMKTRVAA
ncbi:MAG: hypothetical protein O2857_21685, partial [Planctomycetota bacterium]|nr:hypothetical protein [Planctomycetota bacterium]